MLEADRKQTDLLIQKAKSKFKAKLKKALFNQTYIFTCKWCKSEDIADSKPGTKRTLCDSCMLIKKDMQSNHIEKKYKHIVYVKEREAKKLLDEGMSITKVAITIDRSPQTIRRYIKKWERKER
jgi:Zn-finger protein